MEVTSRTVSQLFQGGGDVHYILPHFQRQYAWEKENWATLLEDAYRYFYDQLSKRLFKTGKSVETLFTVSKHNLRHRLKQFGLLSAVFHQLNET